VNVLATPLFSVRDAFDAGAQRVSVGGSLAWAAVDAAAGAAEAIRDRGDFSGLRPGPPLADWFG
jgi:2-methylisocitrate lyase-like PEP mutase family enzyme